MSAILSHPPVAQTHGSLGDGSGGNKESAGVLLGVLTQRGVELTGLWQMFRNYFVNVERSAMADKLQPRNINISVTNNSEVKIDVLVFIFESDLFTIDCESGLITK